MKTAQIFMNGQSQAVRIPKEFRFKEKEILISKDGDKLILEEKKKITWENLPIIADDSFFNEGRKDLANQNREGFNVSS